MRSDLHVAIHQPEHIPYGGFFEKLARADVFVVLDHVQFNRRNFQHRNRLDEKMWLRLHLARHVHDASISSMRLSSERRWRQKYLRSLLVKFHSKPYVHDWVAFMRSVIYSSQMLVDVNLRIIRRMARLLDVRMPQIVLSSRLNCQHAKADLIYEICDRLHADTYVSGYGALDYLDKYEFRKRAIGVDLVGFSDFRSALYYIMEGVTCTDTAWRRCVLSSRIEELI